MAACSATIYAVGKRGGQLTHRHINSSVLTSTVRTRAMGDRWHFCDNKLWTIARVDGRSPQRYGGDAAHIWNHFAHCNCTTLLWATALPTTHTPLRAPSRLAGYEDTWRSRFAAYALYAAYYTPAAYRLRAPIALSLPSRALGMPRLCNIAALTFVALISVLAWW